MGLDKEKLCRYSQVNGFMVSVKSGAKGSLFNLCQMTGMLGQQHLNSARLSARKGFITGSFETGLSPKEFFACMI